MTIRRVLLILSLIVVLILSAGAAVPNRIARNADNAVTFVKDNVHRFARTEFDQGKVEGAFPMQRITMSFRLSAAQQAELESLLLQHADPNSPNYRNWLTPTEYGKRFGLSDADYSKVTAWLKANGFQIVDAPASRTSITFSGTAAQVEAALHTEIHNYVVNGESHYANATSPAVPAAFADVVLGFQSLNDFKPKPHGIPTRKVNPYFTSEIPPNKKYLTPDDVATIYNVKGLYNAGYTGAGQKIVVVGQSKVNTSDITAFRSAAGLSTTNLPTMVLVPGSTDPGIADIIEASLDLEWTGGIAKDATIIYVYSEKGVFDAMQYAITNNLAPVISISYGGCESTFSQAEALFLRQLAQQANSQGITIIASSGDSGAAGCDYNGGATPVTSATHGLVVNIPASLPEVTAIGGTTFNEGSDTYWNPTNNGSNGSALSYIPEIVWNDTAIAGDLRATGGGVSDFFTKPSWQSGTGVPTDGQRDVPDISFAASREHDPYLICSQGSCVNGFRDANNVYLTAVGGTSAGAPVFAGILALINQKTAGIQGNANSKLYSLAASAPSAFHDITSGNNNVPCTTGTTDCASGGTIGYSAGTGYDLATGLGSIDAYALAAAWTTGAVGPATFVLSADTASVTVNAGSPVNQMVALTPINGFDDPVTWSCSVSSELSTLATCSVTPDASTPYRKAVVTITSTKVTAGLHKSKLSLFFAMMAFPMGVLVLTGKTRRKAGFALLALAIVSIGLLSTGCGGGGTKTTTPLTPIQTGVTGLTVIRATSGTISNTLTLSTTVR